MSDTPQTNLGGWTIIEHRGERHVIPSNDLKEHTPEHCECFPITDANDPTVIVHHSFDGREKFETGERSKS